MIAGKQNSAGLLHETARKPNITKGYFGAVSCDLADRPCFPE
jgi:hypothetical protein